MQNSHKKESKKELERKAESHLKTELRGVSLTSDGKVFMSTEKAIAHQIKLFIENKKQEKKDKVMSDINNTIKQVLESNNWGIYFKGEPFQHVPTQDSTSFYKINEVKLDNFLDVIHEKLLENRMEKEWQERSMNSEEKQTDSESSDGSKKT